MLGFFVLGPIPDLDPDPSNFVDPDPHTTNADPHHWFTYFEVEMQLIVSIFNNYSFGFI